MKKKQIKHNGELAVQADKKVISRSEACARSIEISITPPEKETGKERSPLNLSLVLDRSGSMSGEKLHFVKEAAAHVIGLLDERDRVSVVIYDDQVETLVPPGKVTDEFKKQAKDLIQGIRSGNSTFLSGGWLRGCELVAEGGSKASVNRVLLLTDGLANVGVTDLQELSKHSRELFHRGVSSSCFGVGLGYDEHLLEAMANSGGGSFHFLETENAIPTVFEREFRDLMDIALREVEISVPLPKGVNAEVLAGWPNEMTKGKLNISVGSLYAGRMQRIYLKLKFEKGMDGSEVSFPVTVRGKDGEDYVNESLETISFKLVSASAEKSAVVDKELMERFAEVDMADKAKEALIKERAGDRAGASLMMSTSIHNNRASLSENTQDKYSYFVQDINSGMSEESRKRYHREQYENKRGRDADRNYHLQMVNGVLIARIEGQSILVDTGIPISLGKKSKFYFLNEVHPLSQDYMGVTLESLEKLICTSIDVMFGSDILKKYNLTIDLPGNKITFSNRRVMRLINQVPMTNFMGAPIAGVNVEGLEHKMFVDTGAKLSYVERSITAKYSPVGKEKDFYPGVGEFETQVFEIPFQLGGQQFNLRCGVLPKLLEKALLVTGSKGIIGTELYQKFIVCLAYPENAIYLERI